MNFIDDNLSTTIEQLTGLIHRIECSIDQMLNLTAGEINNAIISIQNMISELHQEESAIMSSLAPGSLRYTAGYWPRGGWRRGWASYRGRSKRGGRWHRGWGQRRYTWRSHHYQQEHNYSRPAVNDAITVNVRRGNVVCFMPTTQEAVMNVLPLVQPVAGPTQPSAPQQLLAPLQLNHSAWPQPLLPTVQPPSVLPTVRVVARRSTVQPLREQYSTGRPLFAQPIRATGRFARALRRSQSVRLHVDQPSAGHEANGVVYEPIQLGRLRIMPANAPIRLRIPPTEEADSSSESGDLVVPELIVPRPTVPEQEQVVPIPIVTEPLNDRVSFGSD